MAICPLPWRFDRRGGGPMTSTPIVRGGAGMATEQPGQVRLIVEAGGERDLGKRFVGGELVITNKPTALMMNCPSGFVIETERAPVAPLASTETFSER